MKDKNDMVCTYNGILCCAVLIHSVMSDSAMPWTVARQAPLSMRILQARRLEWVPMPSSRGSTQPRDPTQVSCIAGGFFIIWATREAQEYWSGKPIPSPGESSGPRNRTRVSCIAGGFSTCWAIKKPIKILLSHKKNKILPFATTWIDLEAILLREVSQRERQIQISKH